MIKRLMFAALIVGCGGKSAPAPTEEVVEEEVVTPEAPPDAMPEPPPPPDPWADNLAGDDFSPAAPGPWAALMRPNAAWTLLDVESEAAEIRVTVEQVTSEKIGHVALLKWEARSVDTDTGLGGEPEAVVGPPRRIAVSSKGVWWDSKDSGAFAKKPTFTPKVVKASTKGTTVCLEVPAKKGEECEDDVCAVLCVDGVAGIVSGHGAAWPMGYYESDAAGDDEGEGEEEEEEEEE